MFGQGTAMWKSLRLRIHHSIRNEKTQQLIKFWYSSHDALILSIQNLDFRRIIWSSKSTRSRRVRFDLDSMKKAICYICNQYPCTVQKSPTYLIQVNETQILKYWPGLRDYIWLPNAINVVSKKSAHRSIF